jgi:hypothetical protein
MTFILSVSIHELSDYAYTYLFRGHLPLHCELLSYLPAYLLRIHDPQSHRHMEVGLQATFDASWSLS